MKAFRLLRNNGLFLRTAPMIQHGIHTISIALNYLEGHLCKRDEVQNSCGKRESLSKTFTLKHKNHHWIVFVCLFYFVVDDFQISISCPHLPPEFPHVSWTFSSGCYLFALIHYAWKQTQFLPSTSYLHLPQTYPFLFSIVVSYSSSKPLLFSIIQSVFFALVIFFVVVCQCLSLFL